MAAGALAGIVTGPLVGFYAGARIFCILGRERLLPPLLARMSARFGTPAVATAIQGVAVGARMATLFRSVMPGMPQDHGSGNHNPGRRRRCHPVPLLLPACFMFCSFLDADMRTCGHADMLTCQHADVDMRMWICDHANS